MKRILIDNHDTFSRTAMVEDGRLIDLIVDRKNGHSITGNIYLGLVKNVLPNQFAFIDIGQPKNGFLNGADPRQKLHLRAGQPLLVQVRKDPSGEKGASLSSRLDMTGRLVVLFESHKGEIGVSHKIKDNAERERLKAIVKPQLPQNFGVILRTSSENKSADDILSDLNKQISQYREIISNGYLHRAPSLIYQENNVIHELLREDVDEIVVSDPHWLASVTAEADNCVPGASAHVRLHTEKSPLFDTDIERQIDRALERKIWLNCGGFLIIEQTEACVIIDVNTGKYTGHRSHRESILKTNLEAAKETAAQIRLRNLSGMIIIDFINMEAESDKRQLYSFFSAEIAKDRIKTNIIGMTELGLMQLTRRKTRESLGRIMQEECYMCHGSGYLRRTL